MSGFVKAPEIVQIPGWTHLHTGKVRDLYAAPDGSLVMVASDRISAYDWVLPTEIPDKGRILTELSLWWFDRISDIVPHHVLGTGLPVGAPPGWAGRALVCRRLEMVPLECVARGYLAGSGLTEYRASGAVCGVPLPGGLADGSELPEPIFTPATKAAVGDHDENISFALAAADLGADLVTRLRRLTLAVYARARDIARARGVLLADTKLEFGRVASADTAGGPSAHGDLVLGDEVLTPDSSRFWPADAWQPGRPQPSMDKQYVRDWLSSPAAGWDPAGGAPPPPLPDSVVERTRERYTEVFHRLTGRVFS